MPRFTIVTGEDGKPAEPEHDLEFPSAKAAVEDAQISLAEAVRESLPDGARLGFSTEVKGEGGEPIYRACLRFEAEGEPPPPPDEPETPKSSE